MKFQKFFGNVIFSRGFQGRSPKRDNSEIWRITFSYKLVWIGVIYYGKCYYYVLLNCIRHCVRGDFIQNCFKIFNFLLIWHTNLGFHTGGLAGKPLWIVPDIICLKHRFLISSEVIFSSWYLVNWYHTRKHFRGKICINSRLLLVIFSRLLGSSKGNFGYDTNNKPALILVND